MAKDLGTPLSIYFHGLGYALSPLKTIKVFLYDVHLMVLIIFMIMSSNKSKKIYILRDYLLSA